MSDRDLFISHSSSDADQARALRGILEAAGYTCWMAPDDVTGTDSWASQILGAIDGCRAMLVVVSARSNGSAHVAREVELANARGRITLPVRVEDVRPTGALEYHLTGLQRIDAFPPPIDRHRDVILRRVRATVPPSMPQAVAPETVSPPAPATQPANPVDPAPPPPLLVVPATPPSVRRPDPGIGAWARANSMLAGVAVTLGALFLVGAAAMALSGNGPQTSTAPATGATPSDGVVASPTGEAPSTMPATPAPSRTRPAAATGGAFPTEAEVDLYMALPYYAARDIEDCERIGSEKEGPVARIECYTVDGELVFYEQWADVALLRDDYRAQLRVNMDNPVGSCATSPEGDSEWLRDGVVAGRVACAPFDGGPSVTFRWTDESIRVIATWYGTSSTDPEEDRARGYELFLAWTAE